MDFSMARIARRGFGGLFDARGRDGRVQYWLFLLLVFGPLVVVQIIIQMAITFSSLDLSGSANPGASLDAVAHQFRAMATAAYAAVGLYLIGALLLLTATARRLHDRGRTGWWALSLPLALFVTGLGQARHMAEIAEQAPQIVAAMQKEAGTAFPDMLTLSAKMQARSSGPDWPAIVGGLVLLWLVTELARTGAAGSNRFGEPPE